MKKFIAAILSLCLAATLVASSAFFEEIAAQPAGGGSGGGSRLRASHKAPIIPRLQTTLASAIAEFPTQAFNCYPFGMGAGGIDVFPDVVEFWGRYYFAVYKNIPAFELREGDQIQFDLTAPNEFRQQVDIALALTEENGGTTEGSNYTTIVTNGTSPSPGDTILYNFELTFTVDTPFSFPGGGLIIRITSQPGYEPFHSDSTCTQVLTSGSASDPSGFFVQRFFRSDDGTIPGSDSVEGFGSIPVFRIISGNVSCPFNETLCSENFCYVVTEPGTEAEGNATCAALGGELASIPDPEEYAFINEILERQTYYFSFEGNEFGDVCITLTPGEFGGTTASPCDVQLPSLCQFEVPESCL